MLQPYLIIDVAVLCTTTCLGCPSPTSSLYIPTHTDQHHRQQQPTFPNNRRKNSVMAMSPCKSLILLALLLAAAVFFSTAAATGRSFAVKESDGRRYESRESEFRPRAAPPPEEEGVGDLAEDYTPPRKKPPIHN